MNSSVACVPMKGSASCATSSGMIVETVSDGVLADVHVEHFEEALGHGLVEAAGGGGVEQVIAGLQEDR